MGPEEFQDLHYRQKWWFIPVIQALGRLSQENQKFRASLGYTAIPCLGEQKKKKLPYATVHTPFCSPHPYFES
jgi:hypothetical protein